MSQRGLENTYCFDSSSLIELKRYPKDVFPSVWKALEALIKDNRLISHLEVYKEILAVDDEIKGWCKRNKRVFSSKMSAPPDLFTNFKKVENGYDKSYWDNEINGTKPWADPWVTALAMCYKSIVVNEEREARNKLTYVAKSFGLKAINLLDFFREVGLKI